MFRLRIKHRHADAARDKQNLVGVEMGGFAQRPHDVVQTVAFVHFSELHRGGAHRLDKKGYGALFPVIVGNGERNPFPLFVHAQENKLSRERFGRDFRRGQNVLDDIVGNHCFFEDIKHVTLLYLYICSIA